MWGFFSNPLFARPAFLPDTDAFDPGFNIPETVQRRLINPIGFGIGAMVVVWIIRDLWNTRFKFNGISAQQTAKYTLASILPGALVNFIPEIVYHFDLLLYLLAIPASAALWAGVYFFTRYVFPDNRGNAFAGDEGGRLRFVIWGGASHAGVVIFAYGADGLHEARVGGAPRADRVFIVLGVLWAYSLLLVGVYAIAGRLGAPRRGRK